MDYEPRTMGREIEYGIRVTRNDVTYMGYDTSSPLSGIARRIVEEYRPQELGVSRTYMQNGARMYLDVGAHPEYSSPESTSLLEIATCGIAGDKLMLQTFRNACTDDFFDGQRKYIDRFNLFKNVRAGDNSWGCHENYEITRQLAGVDAVECGKHISAQKMGPAVGFMAIRPLVAGIGYIDTVKGQFMLAQKASMVNADMHSDTVRAKPLINKRDLSFGNDDEIARLHVTSCDPNTPHITVRSMGTTSLMLRLMEIDAAERGKRGYQCLAPQWRASNGWYMLARSVSADILMCEKYSVELSGKPLTMTALDMHELAAEKMTYLIDNDLASSEERWAYDDYVSVLGLLRSIVDAGKAYGTLRERTEFQMDAYGALRSRLDWADRLHVLRSDQQTNPKRYGSHANPLKTDRARQINEVYDLVGTQHGPHLALKRADRPEAREWAPPVLVEERMSTPPEGRARLRGDFVRLMGDYQSASTSWCSLRFSVSPAEGDESNSFYLPLKDSKLKTSKAYATFMNIAERAIAGRQAA